MDPASLAHGQASLAGRTVLLGCIGGIYFQKGKSVRFNRTSRPLLTWRECDPGKGHTVGDAGMMTRMRIMMMKAANVYGKLIVCGCGTKHVTSLCREQLCTVGICISVSQVGKLVSPRGEVREPGLVIWPGLEPRQSNVTSLGLPS